MRGRRTPRAGAWAMGGALCGVLLTTAALVTGVVVPRAEAADVPVTLSAAELAAAPLVSSTLPAVVRTLSPYQEVLMVGHRGQTAGHNVGYTESTMGAFRSFVRLARKESSRTSKPLSGFQMETDIRWSKDGVAFTMHDPTVDRTTNGHGDIASMSARKIGTLWANETVHKERVPRFSEVAALAGRTGVGLQLEIKPDGTSQHRVAGLIRTIKHEGIERTVVVTSRDPANLRMVKKLDSRIATGLLARAPVKPTAVAKYATWVIYLQSVATAPRIASARKAGLGVGVWTPQTNKTFDWDTQHHVGMIITYDTAKVARNANNHST